MIRSGPYSSAALLLACSQHAGPPPDVELRPSEVLIRGRLVGSLAGNDAERARTVRALQQFGIEHREATELVIGPTVSVLEVALAAKAYAIGMDRKPLEVPPRHHVTDPHVTYRPMERVDDPCTLLAIVFDGEARSFWEAPAEMPGIAHIHREPPLWYGLDPVACGMAPATWAEKRDASGVCPILLVIATPESQWQQIEPHLPVSTPQHPIDIYPKEFPASSWRCPEGG